MDIRTINKATASAVIGVGTLAGAIFGEDVTPWLTPELSVGIGAISSPVVVWLIRNKSEA